MATVEFLTFDVRIGYRWSDEKRSWQAQITTTNRGPAVADNARVTLRPAVPGPGLTLGPYELGRIGVGETATRDLSGRATTDTTAALATVGWRDSGGERELSVQVEPPSLPATPASSSRPARRRH